MKRIVPKHTLATRWFHWINFPLLMIMTWSGFLIYWANDVYKISWNKKIVFHFFPDKFYEALHIPYRLAEGMNLHFVFMWFFIINGILYIGYLFISGDKKNIFPHRRSFMEALKVVMHQLHIKRGLPPQKKYNAAQKIAYTTVLILSILITITGFAIYKPIQLNWLCFILGGYEMARMEHFAITLLLVLFFIIHILQVIAAGWKKFSAMITGFDTEEVAQQKMNES